MMHMRTPLSAADHEWKLKEVEKLKTAFDLLSDHVVITDENANILYANKGVERATGFSIAEAIGKNPADLWGGRMPKEFYEKMWQVIKIDKKAFVGEVKNVRKDGTEYWQEVHISPILDAQGEVKFFIGIEPDITTRKEREKFKEDFVSAVGHQLRNPLAAISWVMEDLLASDTLTEADKEKLRGVYREDKGLARFVGDLLVLARMDKGSLKAEPVALHDEITRAMEAVKQRYPAVALSFADVGDTTAIPMIKSLAMQVFLNIMHNAAEHADTQNGRVDVALRQSPEGTVFSCANNGAPISEDKKPLIFAKIPSNTGEGLGLYLVKMISDTLGWRVWFETGEHGTTFYVLIPPESPAAA